MQLNVSYPEQEKHLRILYSNHFHISMTENRVPCLTINGTFHLIILKINESQIQDISSNFLVLSSQEHSSIFNLSHLVGYIECTQTWLSLMCL